MSASSKAAKANRLAQETSPYLLQHAHNPVDWHPWGQEALERAKREDKPILLSIGYAACHWCHVMERESFEDEATAALMNEHFVNIKVDREERPDLDDIYMSATVSLTGHGGWPMTVFLTPDQQPFFAGTYFPKERKYDMPSFTELLQHLAEAWSTQRGQVLEQASELTRHVQKQSQAATADAVDSSAFRAAFDQLRQSFEPHYGGFSQAPKFPPSPALRFLLRYHVTTGNGEALKMARRTLDGMKDGGMYDHVGGGFARYSTDERWLAPHFEKMLYDNAQLAKVYLEAWQLTGDAEYERVARETLDYILREMQSELGGYYSATDADSEGEEGKFFVWNPEQIEAAIGDAEAAQRFCAYYDISASGNWEGKSIANTPRRLEEVAEDLGMGPRELWADLTKSREAVYRSRSQRVAPLLDDKILVAWNGLMIGAMAEGARVLGEAKYLDSARRAADFLRGNLRRPDGGLYRTARQGENGLKAHLDGYLEDYAYLCDALVDLYEAGGGGQYLEQATELAERAIADFGDLDGGAFFHTAHDHEALLVRTREGHDGAIPNPNGVACRALARLAAQLDRADFADQARAAIRAYGQQIAKLPRGFLTTLEAVELLLEGPVELCFVGSSEGTAPLRQEAAKHFLPNRVIAHVDPGASDANSATTPLTRGKQLVAGQAALYVCRNFSCKRPLTDPTAVERELDEALHTAAAARRSTLTGALLEGRATAEATAQLSQRFAQQLPRGYTKLGATQLTVSRLGFGGYRIDTGASAHREALELALRSGVNLIDTSTNYSEGRSEKLVGDVLASLHRAGDVARESVVVVSKIGYVQGPNLELAQERKAAGKPFPEMVELDDDLWHCLHPEWLEDQLTRSLARLGLETLDVALLHNPEYFLKHTAASSNDSLDARRDAFYGRLEAAFRHLEKEVAAGRIGCYGVSSNTVAAASDDPQATSLTRMLAAASAAAPEGHHFRVLQLPLNLLEGEAVLSAQTEGASVLEVAQKRDVAVLVNRPLNAITQHGLLRLAAPAPGAADDAPHFDRALSRLTDLETEYRRNIAVHLRVPQGSRINPATLFSWSEQLAKMPQQVASLESWLDFERHMLRPQVRQTYAALDHAMRGGEIGRHWQAWKERYGPALDEVVSALRARGVARSTARANQISEKLDPTLPATHRKHPLSQKALWALLSTPGVTTVLLGMRDPAYVQDALPTLTWDPYDSRASFEALK